MIRKPVASISLAAALIAPVGVAIAQTPAPAP